MEQEVTFYEPHPGIAGAMAPLPKPMRKAAEELNGQTMSLEGAMDNLQPIAAKLGGAVRIVKCGEQNIINFSITDGNLEHFYSVIKYKSS